MSFVALGRPFQRTMIVRARDAMNFFSAFGASRGTEAGTARMESR